MPREGPESDVPRERREPRPESLSQLPPAKKLPKELQDTLDDEQKLWEAMYEGKSPETTDTSLRYAAYASRLRTIMLSAHRYVAYTSDIGESFRPVAHPWLIRSAYGISWGYIAGDVAYEGYKAYLRNQRALHPEKYQGATTSSDKTAPAQPQARKLGEGLTGGEDTTMVTQLQGGKIPAIEDYRAVMVQRAAFQSIASMGLPAFTIHSIVRYSGRALKNNKNKMIRTWGPISLGLACVPALPYLFDEPVEHAIEWIFHKGFETVGGPEAVHGRPVFGKDALRKAESDAGAAKDKEL